MNLRKVFTKINNAIRPVHVGDQGGGGASLLDAKVTAFGGSQGQTATTANVPSQQDE